MNINESTERILEQTRQLQQSISDALNKAPDQLKPQVENSLHVAAELQATITKYLEASSELTIKNATNLLHHVQEYVALGVGALSDTSEQLRVAAKKLVEQSRKVAEAATDAASSAIPGESSTAATKPSAVAETVTPQEP